MALVDSVMSVSGAPTTAAAVGATDTPLSSTTVMEQRVEINLMLL